MTESNKSFFIDNLKVILIFLVVFGHLIERYLDNSTTLTGIYIFIYIFHMPLFIFISGFLSKNLRKSNKVFFYNLLIPYIVLNTIWYFLAFIYTGEIDIPIIYPGWTLWFLLSLFFWRVSLKYLIKIKYVLPISFILGLIVGLMSNGSILSFSRTIVYLPFFLIGYYTDLAKLKVLESHVNIWFSILGISIFITLAIFLAKSNIIDYKFLYGSYSFSELGMSNWQGLLYRGILYICSILLSIFICIITPSSKTFYTEIGKSTMYVYVFHVYAVILIFYFIPTWDMSMLTNCIIIISPLFITYVLSRNFFAKLYKILFNSIFKLINI